MGRGGEGEAGGGGGSEGGGGTRRPRRAEAPGASWLRSARLWRLLLASTICGRSSARPALCRPWLLSGSIFSSVSDGVLFLTSFTRARSDDSFSNLPSEQTLPALRYLFIFLPPGLATPRSFYLPSFFLWGSAPLLLLSSFSTSSCRRRRRLSLSPARDPGCVRTAVSL